LMPATRTHYGAAYYGVDYYGIVPANNFGAAIEMQLGGLSGAWTDVTDDVLNPINVSYGIQGNTVMDRVASTGTMELELNNSEANSAGLIGYYSPGHANARSGFDIGISVRLTMTDGTNTKRIYGRIPPGGISVVAGTKGARRTMVTVVDWMEQAALYPLIVQALEEDQRIDQVVTTIVSAVPVAPLSTDYNTGGDVFAYAFDTLGTATRALTEFQKLAISEFGYIYVKRDAVYGEVLTVDGAYSRISATSGVTLTNSMAALDTVYSGNFTNKIKITANPREVDAAATTVLYSLTKALAIAPTDTATFTGKYRDPTGGSKQVSGKDMVALVATTDYLFNTAADGTGDDITADLTVSSTTLGANAAEFVLTNDGAQAGYVTFLQCRGKGIYFYDPVVVIAEDTALQTTHGEYLLNIDQKYQDNSNNSLAWAQYWLGQLKTSREDVIGVTFSPSRSAALMTAFLSMDIGSRFTLTEDMTALSSQDYFINGNNFTIDGGNLSCTWIPGPLADTTKYFIWDVSLWDGASFWAP
jgi:hypothetical protein